MTLGHSGVGLCKRANVLSKQAADERTVAPVTRADSAGGFTVARGVSANRQCRIAAPDHRERHVRSTDPRVGDRC
jgi:hypothetical protein